MSGPHPGRLLPGQRDEPGKHAGEQDPADVPIQEDGPGTADQYDTQAHQEQRTPPCGPNTPAQRDGHGDLEAGAQPGQKKGDMGEIDGKREHSGKGHHPPGAPVEGPDGQLVSVSQPAFNTLRHKAGIAPADRRGAIGCDLPPRKSKLRALQPACSNQIH